MRDRSSQLKRKNKNMYIDFHKYNYDLVPNQDKAKFEERDKAAYKKVLSKWIESKADEMTSRKWEIEEIEYLSEVSDFIKLIREGESLYELEFYTSCIALIGVSAEDFLKYLTVKLGKTQYENQTQFNRLNNLLSDGLISQDIYDLLDDIRKIRNDCLHYNQNFKQKDEAELKSGSIKVLNDLKSVLKTILGVANASSPNEYLDIIKELANPDSEDAKNFDEVKMKIRNASSHILKFPMAFEPERKIVVKEDFYLVREIDETNKETTISAVLYAVGAHVVVELTDELIDHINNLGIKENDTIYAVVYSQPNQFGMTEEWNFFHIRKEENFTEIFHDLANIEIEEE